MDKLVLLSDYLPIVEKTLFSEPRGLTTSIKRLDEKTRGLKNSELTIVGGRSSMGKSSLMVDMILANVEQHSLVFSMEMSAKLLIERMIANLAGVNYSSMKSNSLCEADLQHIEAAKKQLYKMKVTINDDTILSPTSVRNTLQELKEKIDIVFLDYIQLMSITSYLSITNRQQEITTISRELKALNKEYNIPFVVLCQLNRQPDNRENTSFRPRMSDLRESGSLEQDADVVLLLYRSDYYTQLNNASATDTGEAEIIVSKNRNGPTGIVQCQFDEKVMSFAVSERRRLIEELF